VAGQLADTPVTEWSAVTWHTTWPCRCLRRATDRHLGRRRTTGGVTLWDYIPRPGYCSAGDSTGDHHTVYARRVDHIMQLFVTFPPLPQPIKAGTRFTDPRGMQGWVDLVGLVTYWGGIPARRRSPIPALTGLNVERLRSCDERRYHTAKPPTRCF